MNTHLWYMKIKWHSHFSAHKQCFTGTQSSFICMTSMATFRPPGQELWVPATVWLTKHKTDLILMSSASQERFAESYLRRLKPGITVNNVVKVRCRTWLVFMIWTKNIDFHAYVVTRNKLKPKLKITPAWWEQCGLFLLHTKSSFENQHKYHKVIWTLVKYDL